MSTKGNKLAQAMAHSAPDTNLKSTTDLVSPPDAKPSRKPPTEKKVKSGGSRAGLTGMIAYVDAETHREVSLLLLDLKVSGTKLTKDELLQEGLSLAMAKYKKQLAT